MYNKVNYYGGDCILYSVSITNIWKISSKSSSLIPHTIYFQECSIGPPLRSLEIVGGQKQIV